MQFPIYRTIGMSFSGFIFANNIFNIPKPTINANKEYHLDLYRDRRLSVIFGRDAQRRIWYAKYISICTLKSIIYGLTWPVAIPTTINDYYGYDIPETNRRRHFVPCSTYFVDKQNDQSN